ncbi:MAG: hypothetical protein EPO07_15815, partial [Verrucomicrobia bacterium]
MKLPINWFDVVFVVMLLTGVSRGRKRGLSEELITMIQWVLLVVISAYAYKPIAQFMTPMTFFSASFSLLFWNVTSYLFVASLFSILYLAVKR